MVYLTTPTSTFRPDSLADGSDPLVVFGTRDIPVWVLVCVHAHDRRVRYALRPSCESSSHRDGIHFFRHHVEDYGEHLDPSGTSR
jgi:hypothetical protein